MRPAPSYIFDSIRGNRIDKPDFDRLERNNQAGMPRVENRQLNMPSDINWQNYGCNKKCLLNQF